MENKKRIIIYRKLQFGLLFFICSLFFASCPNPFIKDILGINEVKFNANGGNPAPPKQNVLRGDKINKPKDPAKNGNIFGGWFADNDTFKNEWDFNEIPQDNMTLYARWQEIKMTPPTTAGIALTVENIVNLAPSPADNISLSRLAGASQIISVNAANFDAGSVRWEIDGKGFYANQTITVTDTSFTLETSDVRYNTLGGHTLRLYVKIDGVDYMRNINFTIVP